MNKYGIIVDSGCDLTALANASNNDIFFTRAPLRLRMGEKEVIDDFSLDVAKFREELNAYPGKTGSAAPSPDEWYNAYQSAEEIFAIALTSSLSGSYSSAMAAKDMILEQQSDKKIHVIDSKSAGPELTLLVYKLQEYIQNGLSFEEIVHSITDYQKRTHLVFVLESLDNFVKNGRVSRLVGNMAGLLGIRIMGCASEEGTLEVLKKCRGKMTSYDKLMEEMTARGYHGGRIVISHCGNEDCASYIAAAQKKQFPDCEITVMPTSGLCSYYAQERGILLAFES